MMLYGFYSAQADKLYGHCWYENQFGIPVMVTGVYSTFESGIQNYCWLDSLYIGKVNKYISEKELKMLWQSSKYYIQFTGNGYNGQYVTKSHLLSPNIENAKEFTLKEANEKIKKWGRFYKKVLKAPKPQMYYVQFIGDEFQPVQYWQTDGTFAANILYAKQVSEEKADKKIASMFIPKMFRKVGVKVEVEEVSKPESQPKSEPKSQLESEPNTPIFIDFGPDIGLTICVEDAAAFTQIKEIEHRKQNSDNYEYSIMLMGPKVIHQSVNNKMTKRLAEINREYCQVKIETAKLLLKQRNV